MENRNKFNIILNKWLSGPTGKIMYFLIPKFTKSFIFINIKFVGNYFLPTNGEFLLEIGICFISVLLTAYIFDLCIRKSKVSFFSKVKKGILYIIITFFIDLSPIFSFSTICIDKLNESEIFAELIKIRDSYLKLWEHYNKANNKSLMEDYGKSLDKVEGQIEEFKGKGYLDPADMPKSAEASDVD